MYALPGVTTGTLSTDTDGATCAGGFDVRGPSASLSI